MWGPEDKDHFVRAPVALPELLLLRPLLLLLLRVETAACAAGATRRLPGSVEVEDDSALPKPTSNIVSAH